MVEPVTCQEDAVKAQYLKEQVAMKVNMLDQLIPCGEEEQHMHYVNKTEDETQKPETDRSKEEMLEKLSDKEQLEERMTQVAELEKKVYDLQEMKKSEEKERQKLRKQLSKNKDQIRSLEKTIERNCKEIEKLQGHQMKSNNDKRDQWRDMKLLLEELFEKQKSLAQTKMAIFRKVESIKRPATA